jgi:peptidoglycan hydrolase-like protein with peptidoglycan-binding domain
MSLFSDPPRTTKYSFKRGDVHLGVWALQRFLNYVYGGLTEDGVFGPATEAIVQRYQAAVGATVDGIVGPQTQERIVRSVIVRTLFGATFPKGLLEGIVEAESGRMLAAANAAVPGGIDLGLTQRRVYGPPFSEAAVKAAMDPLVNLDRSSENLHNAYQLYSGRLGAGEYAWRVAALAHNWPAAADQLSRGEELSTTRIATWAPPNTKFTDGAPVVSWRDWAEYYAIGSKVHNHAGLVTKLAFGVPVR